eukprot:UN22945
MPSRTKFIFHHISPRSNTAHHLILHIFGNKTYYKCLLQNDNKLVIRLIDTETREKTKISIMKKRIESTIMA